MASNNRSLFTVCKSCYPCPCIALTLCGELLFDAVPSSSFLSTCKKRLKLLHLKCKDCLPCFLHVASSALASLHTYTDIGNISKTPYNINACVQSTWLFFFPHTKSELLLTFRISFLYWISSTHL